jgi:hypothetical protein
VKLLRLWRLLGFEWLVNRSRGFRKFWEHYLCFVIRGKAMVFEFEVIKIDKSSRASSPSSR